MDAQGSSDDDGDVAVARGIAGRTSSVEWKIAEQNGDGLPSV